MAFARAAARLQLSSPSPVAAAHSPMFTCLAAFPSPSEHGLLGPGGREEPSLSAQLLAESQRGIVTSFSVSHSHSVRSSIRYQPPHNTGAHPHIKRKHVGPLKSAFMAASLAIATWIFCQHLIALHCGVSQSGRAQGMMVMFAASGLHCLW